MPSIYFTQLEVKQKVRLRNVDYYDLIMNFDVQPVPKLTEPVNLQYAIYDEQNQIIDTMVLGYRKYPIGSGVYPHFTTTSKNIRIEAWLTGNTLVRRYNILTTIGAKEFNKISNIASSSITLSGPIHGTGFDRTRGQQTELKEQVIISGTKPFDKPGRQNVFKSVKDIEKAYEFLPDASAEMEKELGTFGLSSKTRKIIDDWAVKKIIVPNWFANNNINWVLSGHISDQEFLAGYTNLVNTNIITFAQEPQITVSPTPDVTITSPGEITFPSIPQVSAEIDNRATTNMIKQEIVNFTITNNRVKGSIKFTASDAFNPYYYNKDIKNYLQLKSENKTLKIKPNTLRFTEKERDELINFDESAYNLDMINAESYVWTINDIAMSNKLDFIIQKDKETSKDAGLMGAGVVGVIGLIIILGVIGDKLGRNN